MKIHSVNKVQKKGLGGEEKKIIYKEKYFISTFKKEKEKWKRRNGTSSTGRKDLRYCTFGFMSASIFGILGNSVCKCRQIENK